MDQACPIPRGLQTKGLTMPSTNSCEALLRLSVPAIRELVRGHFLCSNARKNVFEFLRKLDVCGTPVDLSVSVMESPYVGAQPDGREPSVSLAPGPVGAGGKVILSLPLSLVLSYGNLLGSLLDDYPLFSSYPDMMEEGSVLDQLMGTRIAYAADLEIALPVSISGEQIKASYRLMNPEDVRLVPADFPLGRFTGLLDGCIVKHSDAGENQGEIPSTVEYSFRLYGTVEVEINWIRLEDPPKILSIDTLERVFTVRFPTLAVFEFPDSADECAGPFEVFVTIDAKIPYEQSSRSVGLKFWEYGEEGERVPLIEVDGYEVAEESSESFQAVFGCLGIPVTPETEKILIDVLMRSLVLELPQQIQEALPDLSGEVRGAVFEELREWSDVVVYDFSEREGSQGLLGRIQSDFVWIGIGNGEQRDVANNLGSGDEFSIAIHSSTFVARLASQLDEERKEFNKSDDRFVDGKEVKIRSLGCRLGRDKFVIDGKAKVKIPCLPDVEADFEADVLVTGVQPSGRINLSVEEPEVSVPCTFVDVILSVLTLGIYAIVRAAVVAAAAESFSAELFSKMADGVDTEPATVGLNDSYNTVVEHTFRSVSVDSDGVGLWGRLNVVSECAETETSQPLWVKAVRKGIDGEMIAIELEERDWVLTVGQAIRLIEDKHLLLANAGIRAGRDGVKILHTWKVGPKPRKSHG